MLNVNLENRDNIPLSSFLSSSSELLNLIKNSKEIENVSNINSNNPSRCNSVHSTISITLNLNFFNNDTMIVNELVKDNLLECIFSEHILNFTILFNLHSHSLSLIDKLSGSIINYLNPRGQCKNKKNIKKKNMKNSKFKASPKKILWSKSLKSNENGKLLILSSFIYLNKILFLDYKTLKPSTIHRKIEFFDTAEIKIKNKEDEEDLVDCEECDSEAINRVKDFHEKYLKKTSKTSKKQKISLLNLNYLTYNPKIDDLERNKVINLVEYNLRFKK